MDSFIKTEKEITAKVIKGETYMEMWFILAQVMGVLTVILDFFTYQVKNNQRKYLLVYAIGSAFWTLMFICLAMSSGWDSQRGPMIAAGFGVIRSMIFWWIFSKQTKQRKIAGKVILYVFLAIALVAGIMSIKELMEKNVVAGIVQIIAMVGALLFVVGQYLPGDHYVRGAQVIYSAAMFLVATPLNILEGERWNIMGMVIEAARIGAIIFFYAILYHKKWLKQKLVELKFEVQDKIHLIENTHELGKEDTAVLVGEIEAMAIKMAKMEVQIIDHSSFNTLETAQVQIQNVLDELKPSKNIVDTYNSNEQSEAKDTN